MLSKIAFFDKVWWKKCVDRTVEIYIPSSMAQLIRRRKAQYPSLVSVHNILTHMQPHSCQFTAKTSSVAEIDLLSAPTWHQNTNKPCLYQYSKCLKTSTPPRRVVTIASDTILHSRPKKGELEKKERKGDNQPTQTDHEQRNKCNRHKNSSNLLNACPPSERFAPCAPSPPKKSAEQCTK